MPNIKKERERLQELFKGQRQLHEMGYELVAGVDEAGRGPLAGPVVAGAVILSAGCLIDGLKDSKLLSEKRRETLYENITSKALGWACGIVDQDYIDRYNILKATELAMTQAVNKLPIKPNIVLVDAMSLPGLNLPQKKIVRGDKRCACIAAASIVAKVTRDRIMRNYDNLFPQYNFKKHKGYGTKAHVEAIKEHGFSPIHRKSFTVRGLET